jgi:hypothetical protein
MIVPSGTSPFGAGPSHHHSRAEKGWKAMLVQERNHINMVEIAVLAILLLAAAVALVAGVFTNPNWLSGAPEYLPTPQQPLPFGFISSLAMVF